MTIVSNDPIWWPQIDLLIFYSYWNVAAGVVMVYDWVLTIGQEIELIWIRCIGLPYSVAMILQNTPIVSLTDAGCNITVYVLTGANVVVVAMLCVIIIARLYAMYHGSRMMLIFLVVIALAVNIACGVISGITLNLKYIVAGEWVLSGTHMCGIYFEGNAPLLFSMLGTIITVWETLALCLGVWIAVKHFREVRWLGPSTGSTIGDCFRVLIKFHVLHFASFVGLSCLQFFKVSPEFVNPDFIGSRILNGALQILSLVQMFVLGPRLILSVREYHAKLVADSDADHSLNSIVFQEHVHISTSSTV